METTLESRAYGYLGLRVSVGGEDAKPKPISSTVLVEPLVFPQP